MICWILFYWMDGKVDNWLWNINFKFLTLADVETFSMKDKKKLLIFLSDFCDFLSNKDIRNCPWINKKKLSMSWLFNRFNLSYLIYRICLKLFQSPSNFHPTCLEIWWWSWNFSLSLETCLTSEMNFLMVLHLVRRHIL